ncbi:vomeronasal type-2 receptor 26-like [Pelodytes ibericus]
MTHLYQSLWQLVLSYLIPPSYCSSPGCFLTSSSLSASAEFGDILIGAVLPFHIDMRYQKMTFTEAPPQVSCNTFLLKTYQQFQAARFALDEINRRVDLLPNITVGFQVYDSCAVLTKEMMATLIMLTGQSQAIPNYGCRERPHLAAVLGHSLSTTSILMAHILGLYRFPQLLHYLQNTHVRLSNGREVFFDKNGDLPAVYDIVNWQLGPDGVMRQVKVGSYDSVATGGDIFTINTSAVNWGSGSGQVPVSVCRHSCPPGFRKTIGQHQPVCCFQCVPCAPGEISNQTDSEYCFKCPWNMWPNSQKDTCLPKMTEFLSYKEPLGAMLTATSATSSLIPIAILGLFYHYKDTPIVRANNYSLSCLLLVSISLCFLCSLNFIGYPDSDKCLIRQVAFGMVFSLCISCILAKTLLVVFAFMATKPDSNLRKWTNIRVSYMIVSICSLLQLIWCICWISIFPPFPENVHTQPEIIIIECNEGLPMAFWCMLGYLGLLSTISFIVAFLARRVPDSFNEAKFITFSMLAFLSVWVSYIPASLSSRGKYVVAMEIFAILSSSWALVACMFLPKCFIILFRPGMNSREHLMVKNSA